MTAGPALAASAADPVADSYLSASLRRLGSAVERPDVIEIAVNPQGLGSGIMTAQQALRPDLMLAEFFWIGFIGLALNALLLAAQGKLFGRAALAEAKP